MGDINIRADITWTSFEGDDVGRILVLEQFFEVDEIGMSDPVAFARARDALPAELRATVLVS